MSRNSHDSARTVRNKNVIGNKNRYLLTVDGVDCLNALKEHAGFILIDLGSLEVGFSCALCLICADFVHILKDIRPLLNIRMLG